MDIFAEPAELADPTLRARRCRRAGIAAFAVAALAATTALAAPATPVAAAPGLFAGPGQPVVFGGSYTVPPGAYPAPRQVNVSLPDGYADPANATRRYPVLYVLDGGTGYQDFVHIAGMVYQGGLWGANAPMIVVGVESLDRRAELTQPSQVAAERVDFPTSGGAERFRRFLVEELKPRVAAAYRTDGTSALLGESLAALFVVDTALRHGTDFDRFLAVSPSLWWSDGELARQAPALLRNRPRTPRTLWLSMADEGSTMQAGLDRLVAALAADPGAGVAWSYHPYPGERHATIYHPAATRAVRDVFPAPPPPPPPAAAP